MYAELTTQNKSWLKRYSHGSRFNVAVNLLNPAPGDRILDYGTSDGFMLTKIRAADPECHIVGYDPAPHKLDQLREKYAAALDEKQFEITGCADSLSTPFNKICCLEVLEHLTEENQKRAISDFTRLLTEDGFLVISVPIEIGPSSVLKNAARYVLGQTHARATMANVLSSLFGLPIDREEIAYIASHIGFNHRELYGLVSSSGFEIVDRVFSPLPLLGAIVNSQVFFVCRKNKTDHESGDACQ